MSGALFGEICCLQLLSKSVWANRAMHSPIFIRVNSFGKSTIRNLILSNQIEKFGCFVSSNLFKNIISGADFFLLLLFPSEPAISHSDFFRHFRILFVKRQSTKHAGKTLKQVHTYCVPSCMTLQVTDTRLCKNDYLQS